MQDEIMIKVDNVSKLYNLGQIGATTLRDELQRLGAKINGKEDPTKEIGTRSYDRNDTFLALDGVSFEVKKGERVGIIGHNGAGKSTLLKLISRITAPTSGIIGLNGRVASMLEVGTGFHGELTGRENIYMNGAILGMTKKEIDAKIENIIDFSECRRFIDTPVKRYSSGMYVKLAFAVSAHLDSEIMIMDEVLAVGDMAFQKKCLDMMNNVSKKDGRTILYVSHNMSTIRQLCDRVIVLDHGKIVFNGDVETGINVYMNNTKFDYNLIDYSSYERDNWFGKYDIRLQKLNINNNGVIIERQQKTGFNYHISSLINIDDVGIRLEIRDELQVPIAASNFFDVHLNSGLNSILLKYDFSMLVIGKYCSVITIFTLNLDGSEVIHDWVPGPNLEIVDTTSTIKYIWDKKGLGCVMLPDPTTVNS